MLHRTAPVTLSLSRVASLGCNESWIKVPSSTVATRQAGGQSAYFQLFLRVCMSVCASATYVGNDVIAAGCSNVTCNLLAYSGQACITVVRKHLCNSLSLSRAHIYLIIKLTLTH